MWILRKNGNYAGGGITSGRPYFVYRINVMKKETGKPSSKNMADKCRM
jgi:hypothetical protein